MHRPRVSQAGGAGLCGRLRNQSGTACPAAKKKTIGIIASGPSCTKEDCETLAEICDEIIAINDCWRLLPTCEHLYGCDSRWWSHWIEAVRRDFDGICWTQHQQWERHKPEEWGLRVLRSENRDGLSTEWPIIHTGRNGGFQALNLAYHLLAQSGDLPGRVLLLGYDMKMRGDQRHWFGAHPEGLEVASNYHDFMAAFRTVDPARYDLEIWNVTRDTALTHFPIMDLDEVCAALLSAPARRCAA